MQQEQVKYILDNINKMSNVKIAQNLCMPVSRITKKIYKLNLNLNNQIINYYPNFIFYSKNEKVLYNIISKRLENKLLIDASNVNVAIDFNLYEYCNNNFGMGYENYLLTFFNIDYKKYIFDNCIEIYLSYKYNKIKQLPYDFWEDKIIHIVVNYVLKYKYNISSEEDFYNNYSANLIKEIGLKNYIAKNKITLYDLANIIYPNYDNYPFRFKKIVCPIGYWKNEDNIILAIDYLLNELINTGEIILNDPKEVTKINKNILKKYNLTCILQDYNISEVMNIYIKHKCGIQLNIWEFISVPNNFWYDMNNVINATKWLLEEIYGWDGKDIEWIKYNYNNDIFNNNKLGGMLVSSPHIKTTYDLLYNVYPDIDIFPWEFKMSPKNYWIKENADLALKQLIENRLKINIDDIPKHISNTYFKYNYQKFMLPLNSIYEGNIFKWIDSIYPNKFTCRDFGYIESMDSTIVKSHAEQIIHNYLITKYKNVRYIPNKKEYLGIYDNRDYFPDWIIDDEYVLEYLGLLKKKLNKNSRDMKYYNKTIDKLELSNKSDLEFIFIYEEDLMHELKGLITKLSIIE